jgi:hypothetical protein
MSSATATACNINNNDEDHPNGHSNAQVATGQVSSINMTTVATSTGASQRVVLRSHVRREASDVKAARKQVTSTTLNLLRLAKR